MSLFTSYAITTAAMRTLVDHEVGTHPTIDGWFDFELAHGLRRLKVVDLDHIDRHWSRTADAQGTSAVLVTSSRESGIAARGDLPDGVRCIPVSTDEAERRLRTMLLQVLREPDQWLVANWASTTLGGGARNHRFADVNVSTWWACGAALRTWVRRTARGMGYERIREVTPDFSRWRCIPGQQPVRLDDSYWNPPSGSGWSWHLSRPCTPDNVPAMRRAGFSEYYPMHTLPCCGIARRWDGLLVPQGALPDERNEDGHWLWDGQGRVEAQLARGQRRTFAEWVSEAFGALTCQPWRPAIGWMSGNEKSAEVNSEDGTRVRVRWTDDEATVTPLRSSSDGQTLWITAVQSMDPDGALLVLWTCPFRFHEERTSRGIPATDFYFVITPSNLEATS